MTDKHYVRQIQECPIVDVPNDYHFRGVCEDCDIKSMARMTMGEVDSLYRSGSVTQDEYEAYMYVWALLSPAGSLSDWKRTPIDLTVRRIARKIIARSGFKVPKELKL